MAWDGRRNHMTLVDNNGASAVGTWTWNGAGWTRQAAGDLPAGTYVIGLAVDPVTGELLAASCCATGQATTSTFAWNGFSWRRLVTRTQPLFTVTLAVDPVARRVVLCADPSLVGGRDMWSWTGRDWRLLEGGRLPVFPEAEVTDTASGHLVIVGSFAEPVQGAPQQVHVWSWDATTWTQVG